MRILFLSFISYFLYSFVLTVQIYNRVCRICKVEFNPLDNKINPSCRYHSGKWLGAELSKHYGTKSGDNYKGLALFWDCCNAENVNDKGCKIGFHKSYDDEDDENTKYFVNRKNP